MPDKGFAMEFCELEISHCNGAGQWYPGHVNDGAIRDSAKAIRQDQPSGLGAIHCARNTTKCN